MRQAQRAADRDNRSAPGLAGRSYRGGAPAAVESARAPADGGLVRGPGGSAEAGKCKYMLGIMLVN